MAPENKGHPRRSQSWPEREVKRTLRRNRRLRGTELAGRKSLQFYKPRPAFAVPGAYPDRIEGQRTRAEAMAASRDYFEFPFQHAARMDTAPNTRPTVAPERIAGEMVSECWDETRMLLLTSDSVSRFLGTQDLGRLEQCSKQTRMLASEGWSSKARELELRVEAREGSKQALERFVCLSRFASRSRNQADAHYLGNDGQYHYEELDYEGFITYANPCNDEHCDFPRTLEVGDCFERPDEFHFFLLLSYGDMVLHNGYVTCRRAIQSSSVADRLWNTVHSQLHLDLEGVETNGDLFNSLNRNTDEYELDPLKPLRVVLLCSRRMPPVFPMLVVATAIGDDFSFDNEPISADADVCRWLLRALPVITHGGTHGGTRRLGEVTGEIHTLGTKVGGIIIRHDLSWVQYDHVNYPNEFPR